MAIVKQAKYLMAMFLATFFWAMNVFALGVGVSGGEREVEHQAITIWSEGIRLAGDIYKPKNRQADERLPLISVPR
ncbi:MAG: hypothetical protein AB8B81_22250 [Halioglobus sp.]